MTPKNKTPATAEALESLGNGFKPKHNKPTTKRHRILLALALGERLTRFDAEHLMDHCLNTTISEIGRYDGIIVSRQFEKHESREGHPFHCCRYWLSAEQRAKALKCLGVVA